MVLSTPTRNLGNLLAGIGIRPTYRAHMQNRLRRDSSHLPGSCAPVRPDLISLRIVRILQHHLTDLADAADLAESAADSFTSAGTDRYAVARQLATILNTHGWAGTQLGDADGLLLCLRFLFQFGRTGQIRWRRLSAIVESVEFSRQTGRFVISAPSVGTVPSLPVPREATTSTAD